MSLRTARHVQRLVSSLPCCHQTPLRVRCSNIHQAFRSRSSRLFADAAKSRQTPSRSSAPRALPPRIAPLTLESESALLNRRAKDRVRDGESQLYTGSSNFGYMWTGWIGGAICFGEALLITEQGLISYSDELHWSLSFAYRFIILFLGSVGTWAILRSSRRITAIDVKPGPLRPLLSVSVRRNLPLPFLKPRVITVPASDVEVGRTMVTTLGEPLDSATLDRFYGGKKLSIRSRLSLKTFQFFAGARQYVYADGLISIYIRGYRGYFKMDAHGFLLDDGAPLSELVKFRKDF